MNDGRRVLTVWKWSLGQWRTATMQRTRNAAQRVVCPAPAEVRFLAINQA